MASIEKKIGDKRCGPGGMKCRCCGPALGKPRKAFKRAVKRGPIREHVRHEIDAQDPRWDKRKASFVLDDEDEGEGLLEVSE